MAVVPDTVAVPVGHAKLSQPELTRVVSDGVKVSVAEFVTLAV